MFAQENYSAYYKRTAAPYKAKSLIGGPPHLNKLLRAWPPYRKLGTFGVISAKGSGLWRIAKFWPPTLLTIQTTWLRIIGRKDVCRGIVIDKLKPC